MLINTTTREEIIKTYKGDYEVIGYAHRKNLDGTMSGTITLAPKWKLGEMVPSSDQIITVEITSAEWDAWWEGFNSYDALDLFANNKLNA